MEHDIDPPAQVVAPLLGLPVGRTREVRAVPGVPLVVWLEPFAVRGEVVAAPIAQDDARTVNWGDGRIEHPPSLVMAATGIVDGAD